MPDSPPDAVATSGLPAAFRFGVAGSATSTDGGSADRDDLSIWDVFAAAPGRVTDGTGPADGPRQRDHLGDDLDLLVELGVDAYRCSLRWSASPEGMTRELDYQDKFVDTLLSRGVMPVLTLSHYDMPLTIMADGGWLTRDTAEVFASWAERVASRLADRVEHWVTMNAPLVHTCYGYGLGVEAPGLTLLAESLQAGRWQLVGHGLATQALRAAGARRIGIANAHTAVRAASSTAEDLAAATLFDALHNRAFTDPLFGLPWPEELSVLPGAPDAAFSSADAAAIATPLDFYGVNYYHPQTVQADSANATIPFALMESAAGVDTDEFGWPTEPAALTTTLIALTRRHPRLPPLWITENGTQDSGGTDDEHRAAYLRSHLGAVADAIALGVDVRAYFHWTLVDGWEFAEGLTRKFGLVAVDAAGRRTPKSSFAAYRQFLATRSRP